MLTNQFPQTILANPSICLCEIPALITGTLKGIPGFIQFALTFLTNPSKHKIYLCKIPAVITETLIV